MKSKLGAFLLAFLMIAGFQITCEAQMTVTNNASCTIFVSTMQEDMTTAPRCDWCNISAITTIAPGATVTFPRSLACGRQVWSVVGWGTNSFGLTSSSWNPAYLGSCLPDVLAATCGPTLPPLNIVWTNSGAGPASAVIF